MNSRAPLRAENLKEFVQEVLDRLPEMSEQDLERIATSAEQILFDNDVDEFGNFNE